MRDFAKQNVSDSSSMSKPFFSGSAIQAKLKIGQVNDKYEQEADHMASRVVQGISASTHTPGIQHKCAECESEGSIQRVPFVQMAEMRDSPEAFKEDEMIMEKSMLQRELMDEEEALQRQESEGEEEELLQTKPLAYAIQRSGKGNREASEDFQSQLQSSKGGGKPISNNTRSQMESSFGADFSKVKVHTGTSAVQMSQNIGAKAFTHQNHIYFNQGQYNPESGSGKQLLAHELTHTIQQGASSPIAKKEEYS